jgi:hypothetical protein
VSFFGTMLEDLFLDDVSISSARIYSLLPALPADKLHKYPDKQRDDNNIICESEEEYEIWQSVHRHEDISEYSEREKEFCYEWCSRMSKGFPGMTELLFEIFKTSNKVKKFHKDNDYSSFIVASFSSSRSVFQFLVVAVTASFLSKNMVENFVMPYPSGQ